MDRKELDKKNKELEVAEFFVSRLNKKYSLDYNVQPNMDEQKMDTYVDVFANSIKNDRLLIQIVTAEGQTYSDFAENRRAAMMSGSNFASVTPVRDRNTEKRVLEMISKKKVKDTSNVTLLVYSEFGSLVDEKYAKNTFPGLFQGSFDSVFWVKLPSKEETSSHPDNGQIVAIKNSFGEDGESF